MTENTRYIIGQGESLSASISLNQGGGDKSHPYSFDEAAAQLSGQIEETIKNIDSLPDLACPDDQAVVAITLHPSYLAKSYHPRNLISGLGLRQVGSRERRDVVPRIRVKETANSITSEIFVAGSRSALRKLRPSSTVISQSLGYQDEFRRIESVRALGIERLKSRGLDGDNIPIEVVVHVGEENNGASDAELTIIDGFYDWIEAIQGLEVVGDYRSIGALAFFNLRANTAVLNELIQFSFVRVARRMPRLSLRHTTAPVLMFDETFAVGTMPQQPINTSSRIAIFDGGLHETHPFGTLVRRREPLDIGDAYADAIEHGTEVTSAALFGPLEEGVPLQQPYCSIDHWRVIDIDSDDDFALTAVRDRIVNVLESEQYPIISLSLGPDDAMVDDEVNIWTATMDEIGSLGKTVIICAAGNNGEDDDASGLNRIQPSADGVNVFGVGARDTLDNDWSRAPYSAIGPGRSPGIIKPDCVAMGGDDFSPYFAIREPGKAFASAGTSLSAPTAAWLASGVHSYFPGLTATSIRCLLIHTAYPAQHQQTHVGWGSLEHSVQSIVACADDSATIVYQGQLASQRHMRYRIPVPAKGFSKQVEITATFIVATPVDPEDAVSYSQVATPITFRPNTSGDPGLTAKGKPKAHPSDKFFGQSAVYQSEQELRDDAHRWEPVKKAIRKFRSTTLVNPVFDVEHLVRRNGAPVTERRSDIPYSLVVTIREKDNKNLYSDILNNYPQLAALSPAIDIDLDT